MATDDLNFADVDEVAAALVAIDGVRSASRDGSEVQTPGVWIRFDGCKPGTLQGLTVSLTLHAVVAKTGNQSRDQVAVAALYNLIKPVIELYGGTSGDVKNAGLILPGSTAGLPCLQVPLDLLTVQPE